MRSQWMTWLALSSLIWLLGGCDFTVDKPEQDCLAAQCEDDTGDGPDDTWVPPVDVVSDTGGQETVPQDQTLVDTLLPDVVIPPEDSVEPVCIVSGCSGQICAVEAMDSDCEWKEEYACLKLSECGPFGSEGGCAWLETAAYLECMAGICTPEAEICGDLVDNDCDGLVDEGCDADCADDADCDDGDPCTMDYCKDGICIAETMPDCGECVGEGENGSGFVPWPAPTCCDGLTAIDVAEYDPEMGSCVAAMDIFICAKCGNGSCEQKWENVCNCPEDCKVSGECQANTDCLDENPCTEDVCKEGKCINQPIEGCEQEGCWLDEMCPEGSYCRFPDAACDNAKSGSCTIIPEGCFDLWAPVCGCDGQTYGNECELQVAKQSLAYEGQCQESPQDCGGIMGLVCDQGQYCQFPEGTCNWADMMGSCIDVPFACPDVWMPVCGCDGKTYGNGCEMAAAKMSMDHEGACQESKCATIDPQGYGMCLAIIGIGFDGNQCVMVSGCGCGNDCDKFFDTIEECKAACL